MARNRRTAQQICRYTNGFTKKPSVRQKIKEARERAESIRNEVANYDEEFYIANADGTSTHHIIKASDTKFGIFNKKGYRAIKLFYTREEAEHELSLWKRPDLYEVREIEWFEEDKENN